MAPTSTSISTSGSTSAPGLPLVESNGIQIQRLKNKLGTKSLPTAELVLKGVRAHLIGKVGQGTKEISSILNITRIHTAVGGVGGWGRGLAISRAFSRVRKANGRLLMDLPAHVRGMAAHHTEYRGYMLFSFFAVALLGVTERGKDKATTESIESMPEQEDAVHLLRLLTPILKATASLASIAGLRFCMESLGGIGYLENEDVELNVARLFRDTNVLSIWEGTTDVLGSDTVRVLKGRDGQKSLDALDRWISQSVRRISSSTSAAKTAVVESETLKSIQSIHHDTVNVIKSSDADTLLYSARDLMETLSWLIICLLLLTDASRDGNAVAAEISRRWIAKRLQTTTTNLTGIEEQNWRERADWDRKIVFDSIDGEAIASPSAITAKL